MGRKRAKITIAVVIDGDCDDDGQVAETRIFEAEGTTEGSVALLARALLSASKADADEWTYEEVR